MSEEVDQVERDDEVLALALAELAEHFDTVRIFVTRDAAVGNPRAATIALNVGTGNYYAQAGQVREWMLQQDEITRKGTE